MTQKRLRPQQPSLAINTVPPSDLLYLVGKGHNWRAVEKVLKNFKGNRLGLEKQLEEWWLEGWLEIEEWSEPYHSQWRIAKIRLSETAYQRLVQQPRIIRQSQQDETLFNTLNCLKGWREDLIQAQTIWELDDTKITLLQHLGTILQEQETALTQGKWISLFDRSLLGDPLHQRWLQILRGLLHHLTRREWQYERTFSANWLSDSKKFSRDDWKKLEGYLGIEFSQIGLFQHTPIVFCWGNFKAEYFGHQIDGMAGFPFVAVSAETIPQLTNIQIGAKAIFLVENQTAFETILRPPLCQNHLLYLFSKGHPGSAIRNLLAVWLRTAPQLDWYIWTDWDLGGIRIQADWMRWSMEQGLSEPHPWGWDDDSLVRWQNLGKVLSLTKQMQLQKLQHPLAEKLLTVNYTLEQEAVLQKLKPSDFLSFR